MPKGILYSVQRSREHKKVIREEFEASNIVLEKHE
jgi:hypothetical protein